MNRRDFLQTSAVAFAMAVAHPILGKTADVSQNDTAPFDTTSFEFEEITIAELQAGMQSGKFSARSITEAYFRRIEQIFLENWREE